jgi:hypothetical protein
MVKVKNNNFKIKFSGQEQMIDANILISSLVCTADIVYEINTYLNTGKKVEVKVKALDKGSFIIDVVLIESMIDTLYGLFTHENINTVIAVITMLVEIYALKLHLKDTAPKHLIEDGNSIKIENVDGNVIIVQKPTYNVYTGSSKVQDSLARNFNTLNEDPAITDFSITDGDDNAYIAVNHSDFSAMAVKSVTDEDDCRVVIVSATLHIVRLSFERNLKWEFVYQGNKITAKIKDEAFYQLIDNRERFAKGDELVVEMEISQRWDESVRTYLNSSYLITRVDRHINVEQLEIGDIST